MLLIALTGGIATGKSVVARVFQDHGCYIHAADDIAHELMEPGRPAWEKIVGHFGEKILNPDQSLNRVILGRIVFADEAERNILNGIIHPLVLDEKRKTIERLEKEGRTKIFVSEAALTIEAGFAEFFDKIVVVTCAADIQIRRLMDRDRLSREEALRKIGAQMPAGEKTKCADYVIDTSGALEETLAQAERVYAKLAEDFKIKMGLICSSMRRRGAGS